MTTLRQRLAALSMFAALAVVLGFAAFSASPASAQAPALEVPPLPMEDGAIAIRGDGTRAEDGVHLVTTGGTDGYRLEGGELEVEDDDGSFEVRAYVIGDDNSVATVYVRTTEGDEVQTSQIFIRCPEADECMSASDFHVNAGAAGTWHVDVEYGEGKHGAWQLEVYTNVATEVLHLPPFPAPPVHAIRGNGERFEGGKFLLVTDSNNEIVERGSLIVEDQDGTFDVVVYLEGPDQATAQVNVYEGETDGRNVRNEKVTIECPNADICLQTRTITVRLTPGTYAVDVEYVSGELGPWQLEVYNFVLPADAGDDLAGAEDEGSDSLQGDEETDSMMADGADDDAMALPTGGTGGLFQASARTTIPVAVSLAGLIAGLAIFGIALRARRNAA